MKALTRTVYFTAFCLLEYARSGRILIELLVTVAGYYLLFRKWTSGMTPEYFFSTASLFVLGVCFYTSSAMYGLGNRPQGYLTLMRKLGRGGYLIGFYLAALVVDLGVYLVLSVVVALFKGVPDLSLREWIQGSLPLVLNIALFLGLLLLLAPMVLTAGWRLLILGIVATAFSGNLLSGQTLNSMWPPLAQALNILRTLFSAPLLPAFAGFSLAMTRDYSGASIAIPVAQLSLALGILSLALYAFARRELIFTNG